MSFAELFRALLFVMLMAAIYAGAFGVVVRRVKSRGQETLFGRRRDAAVVVLALIGIGCYAWSLVEPHRVEVTHVRVPVPGLSGQDHVRIVQISDVHSGSRARLEESLPDTIARQSPDLIVFTGDALNAPNGAPVFRRLMTRLAAIAPTYAVKGNWDVPAVAGPIFKGTGARELDGEFVPVEVNGARVCLVGANFGESLRLQRAVDSARATMAPASENSGGAAARMPVIVLAHSPDAVEDAKGADLLLAGHTHGGQVRLPWYGALITLTHTGKQLESGLHRAGRTWVYTNRGIGVEPLMPVRFLCRPEVTVIDLVPQH